jgi:hypothetical protein
MNTTTLLPGGVFVPTSLIFHPDLPHAVLVTWIQLRCLAGDGCVSPAIALPQLAARLGLHPARLNQHLARLQEISALKCSDFGHEMIVISFSETPGARQAPAHIVHAPDRPAIVSPEPRQVGSPASYFPARILGYLSYEDDELDPLSCDKDIAGTQKEFAHQAVNISRLVACHPSQQALAVK